MNPNVFICEVNSEYRDECDFIGKFAVEFSDLVKTSGKDIENISTTDLLNHLREIGYLSGQDYIAVSESNYITNGRPNILRPEDTLYKLNLYKTRAVTLTTGRGHQFSC